MKDFKNFLIHNFELDEADVSEIIKKFNIKKIKKKEAILEIGKIENNLYFLLDGIVQMYFYDKEIGEVTFRFFRKNDFFTFLPSFLFEVPSDCGLSTLAKSQIAYTSKKDLYELFSDYPKLEQIYNRICYEYFINISKTNHKYHVLNATDKYKEFLKEYRDIVNFIPIKNISSFLGIHQNSLSRIRKSIK